MSKKQVRTRIAPSPTGFPHIGTAYQALIDKAIARKLDGKFVVRIEDTDRKRFVTGAEESLLKALDWLNLSEDEGIRKGGDFGPYRQSKRLSIYKKYSDQLLNQGDAYRCFCTKERLDKVRKSMQKQKKPPMYDGHCLSISKEESDKMAQKGKPFVIRMRVKKNQSIKVVDAIRGQIEFNTNTIDDQVILKTDGFPTYHLAVVVDDHLMQISHVVRGPEWIPSFPKHALLYKYFGWEMPIFIHTPLITNMDGSKMSKRNKHTNLSWYKDQGILPEALINFMCLLGWSHPKQVEKFSYKEFIKNFDYKKLSAVNPKFDLKKLEWLNGQYIKDLTEQEFYDKVLSFNTNFKNYNQQKLKVVLPQIKSRVRKLVEVKDLIDFFFVAPTNFSEITKMANKGSKLSTKQTKEQIKGVLNVLKKVDDWNETTIDRILHNYMEKMQIKPRQFFMPIRVIISGKSATPPLGNVLKILGKRESLNRLNSYLSSNC